MHKRYKKQGKAVKWREHKLSIFERHREFRAWQIEMIKKLQEPYQ